MDLIVVDPIDREPIGRPWLTVAIDTYSRCIAGFHVTLEAPSATGQPTKPVVLVEDNGPIHTSKLSLAALAARAHWLTAEWLPKYVPGLNDIEIV
jgi:transposase InsO family protein